MKKAVSLSKKADIGLQRSIKRLANNGLMEGKSPSFGRQNMLRCISSCISSHYKGCFIATHGLPFFYFTDFQSKDISDFFGVDCQYISDYSVYFSQFKHALLKSTNKHFLTLKKASISLWGRTIRGSTQCECCHVLSVLPRLLNGEELDEARHCEDVAYFIVDVTHCYRAAHGQSRLANGEEEAQS